MPTVTVEDGPSFEVAEGTKLVLAIEDAGVDILHRCGGVARCTTCRVEILGGEAPAMQEAEQARLATENELPPNTRLSCQIRVESDLTVRVLRKASTTGLAPGTRPED
jgi:ferredoxin